MNKIPSIRLISHQLSSANLQTPRDTVSWMCAMQAQDYNMAKWAIGLRSPGCTDKAVEEAFNSGNILRTHVMRPTWHFVTPENIRWMSSLSADKIKSSAKYRDQDLGITESLYGKTNQLIQKSLEGNKHLTRDAIAKELEKAGITVNAFRMVHFMMRAEIDGLVCSGALQGKTHTYALIDERVPPVKPLHREEAVAKLAQLYFTSHCPATLQDFVWWSGLSQAEARKGLEAVKPDFVSEEIDGQIYYIANTLNALPNKEKSAYLLPAFDEYIISYRDRKAVLPSENHSKAISSNGVFRPVVVVDGQAIGLWKQPTNKNQPITFDFFEQPDTFTEKRINEAAHAFKVFKG